MFVQITLALSGYEALFVPKDKALIIVSGATIRIGEALTKTRGDEDMDRILCSPKSSMVFCAVLCPPDPDPSPS